VSFFDDDVGDTTGEKGVSEGCLSQIPFLHLYSATEAGGKNEKTIGVSFTCSYQYEYEQESVQQTDWKRKNVTNLQEQEGRRATKSATTSAREA
jgi:hypothetical protein